MRRPSEKQHRLSTHNCLFSVCLSIEHQVVDCKLVCIRDLWSSFPIGREATVLAIIDSGSRETTPAHIRENHCPKQKLGRSWGEKAQFWSYERHGFGRHWKCSQTSSSCASADTRFFSRNHAIDEWWVNNISLSLIYYPPRAVVVTWHSRTLGVYIQTPVIRWTVSRRWLSYHIESPCHVS